MSTIAERTVTTTWTGTVNAGLGEFGASSSGVLDGLQVTWASRTVRPDGKTSPEELLAAAHSSCFSMALGVCLGQHQLEPEQLRISANVRFAEVDGKPTIDASQISIVAKVPGVDDATFQTIVGEAAALCPVSRLFAGAEITVEATLEG